MINGKLEQFLDTGWFSEATLFFDGNVYWFEGDTNPHTRETEFAVTRWKAILDNKYLFHSICLPNGDPLDYDTVLSLHGYDMDEIKMRFLKSPVFNGKTFWEVERELVWVEEGTPIISNVETR